MLASINEIEIAWSWFFAVPKFCHNWSQKVQFFTDFVSIFCKNGYQLPGFGTG